MNPTYKIHHAKAEQFLKGKPYNSIPAILSDFPYGLKFMGKKWNYGLPSQEAVAEMYRALMPSGYLLGFSSPRTYHRLAVLLEDAGFEIRDCIMWIYGSGFPKGRACLKPAYEPIIVARKAGKVLPLNIDECRVAGNSYIRTSARGGKKITNACYGEFKNPTIAISHANGRYPSNVLLDLTSARLTDEQSGILNTCDKRQQKVHYGKNGDIAFTTHKVGSTTPCYNDIGGASRFFHNIEWGEDELPRFIYNGKACPSDRNYGMPEGVKNDHPTVKPIKLMRHLARLINQPNNPNFYICDPYIGSGTTGASCMLEGIPFEGCDMEEASYRKAMARTEFARREYLKTQDLFTKAS